MSKFKVLIADSRYESYDEEVAVLRKIKARIITDSSDNEDKIAEIIGDVDAVIVNLAPITAKVISGMNKCKCISRYGVGVDNVDVNCATTKNIVVTNVREYCNEDVSDHALALLFACVRKTSLIDKRVRTGDWDIAAKKPMYRIAGKTLGLIGYGGIARTLHRKITGLGLSKILVYDPYVPAKEIKKNGARKVELDDLLTASDFISIHAPLTESTRHMIGPDQFKLMKNTAILVNTSRGPLVDPDALFDALKNGTINSAGIDVHEPEPPQSDCKLFDLDNVVLTDHTGWYTEESQGELKRFAAQNAALVLTGKPPLFCVNPEVLKSSTATG